MGYRTYYTLSILDLDGQTELTEDVSNSIIKKLRMSCEDLEFAVCENGSSNGDCKWYEHDRDMTELSKQFPNVIFQLDGNGEESEDIWTSWYHDGKIQGGHVKIIYPEFSPDKWEPLNNS